MSQQTITGELRKWRLHNAKGNKKGVVSGAMYNDVNDIWENGEAAVIHFVDWVESANFYLAVCHGTGCIKLSKDEERKDAPGQKLNGSDNPEKG